MEERLRPPQEAFERRPEPSRVPGIGCNLPLPIFALFNLVPTMLRTNEVYPGRLIFWRVSPPGYTFKLAGLSMKRMTFTVKPGRERTRTRARTWLDELVVVDPQCPSAHEKRCRTA